MSVVATPAARRRRSAAIALVTAAAATITAGSTASRASAQVPLTVPTLVTDTAAQLLNLAGGVSPQKLRMIEEEGYVCFMALHRVPPGISWVCIPPLQ